MKMMTWKRPRKHLVPPLLLLVLGLTTILLARTTSISAYQFALVPKTTDNPFFILAQAGCEDSAALLHNNSTCTYGGVAASTDIPNPDPNGTLQVDYVRRLLQNKSLDGLAVSVKNAALMGPILDAATIPVVTFDSDLVGDVNIVRQRRAAYVGTDNIFLGQTLAKVAQQIVPGGGTFALVSSDRSPNVRLREQGVRQRLLDLDSDDDLPLWRELAGSPAVYQRDLDAAVAVLESLAQKNPTAIVTTVGGPLLHAEYANFWKRHRHRNITIIAADDFELQIAHLSRGYVQGLVGQMPYEMGALAVQVLVDLIEGRPVPDQLGTNLITHIQVPLVLPELQVDNNLINSGLRAVGYTLLSVIWATAVGCALWTFHSRKQAVVQAAQPVFLTLVALGVAILAATLVPLSMDDDGGNDDGLQVNDDSDEQRENICMAIPWLGCCGLTITFSALFSKTIRINRIMSETRQCHRVKVSATDVMLPFAVLLTLNVMILVLWSILDPLTYVRTDYPGKDGWQRTISTYGACRCEHPWAYLTPLALINLGLLIMANWQAYKSRQIRSEFSESKYIALCMASLLEALLIGIPILFVVRSSPQAFYLTISFMLFVICMGVLMLIFIPKMVVAGEYSSRSLVEQQRMLLQCIRESVTVQESTGVACSTPRSSASKNEERESKNLETADVIKEEADETEESGDHKMGP